MRGGSRVGAGRKKGEDTVRRRVPVGCLSAVDAVIAEYKKNGPESEPKQGQDFETTQESKPVLDAAGEAKVINPAAMILGQEIKKPVSEAIKPRPIKRELTDEQKAAMRQLERLHKSVIKKIRANHGTLAQAVLDGVRAYGKEAYLCPDEADNTR